MDIVYEVSDGGRTQTRFITFDALLLATPLHSAQVTERNVERGSNITDHVVAAQARLSFEAFITNAPLHVPDTENDAITGDVRSLDLVRGNALYPEGVPRSASVLQFDQEFDRCRGVYEQLVDIVENGRLVSINVDRLPAFNGMVIVNLSAPLTVEDGDAIRFTFDAVRIRFVDSQTVAIDASSLSSRTSTRKKRGHQPTKPATEQEEQSFLAAGADRLFGR